MSKVSFPLALCAVIAMCRLVSCVNYCNRTEYATIVYLSFLDDAARCEGTLLNLNWVLTSASCVHLRSTDDVTVDLGVPYGGRNVTSIVPHPAFDQESGRNDVALLAIEPTFWFEHAPSLVFSKLPEPAIADELEDFNVMQWGKGEAIEPPADCADLFTAEELRDATGLLCAVPSGAQIRDAEHCASHRGGPLECDGVQTGVASWGRCDGRRPAAYVYAEVTPAIVAFASRTISAGGGRYLDVAVAVATGLALLWLLRRQS